MSTGGLKERLDEATGLDVSRETLGRLAAYEDLLRSEAARQNLISAATLDDLASRHIVDSAQLIRFVPANSSTWVDIGSGAGLPGIVVACLVETHVTLIEPRRLRADFLHRVTSELGLNASVVTSKVERVEGKFGVITARAVANLSQLLRISAHLSTRKSLWVLPKGRNAEAELAEARKSWQGVFHVKQSVTDPDSRIIVASGVAQR